MARFKKFRAPKVATVVGTGTDITGDVTFSGGLHVDGSIHGNIMAEQDGRSALTLSEQGTIEGDITVPNIMLNGTVIGDVYASERVELAPKARVTGTVYYNLLEMNMGAEVNGQLIHSEDGGQRMLGYDGGKNGGETAGAVVPPPAEDGVDEASERIPRGR